ncbi:ABC transporter substrate-binding protein [Dawidia soli]|uniref:ABC transporter substrate-binding protein n=1 Tax=Dawidia soli TaxID=2782352 RepID=A0AAP2D8V5_9BACT|nr:ABC transporter substrate-binding protein [Dawidia soli]MBT1687558.1 ABC transporter substrate-binding protein [Dawidia soli]
MYRVIIFVLVLSLTGCRRPAADQPAAVSQPSQTLLKYARGFTVAYDGNIKTVTVLTPFQGASKGFTYLLVPRDEAVPAHAAGVKVIRTPLSSIVCTSTSHIPLLDYLGETDKLVGFPSTDYISSEKMRRRVDAGLVKDLGVDSGINLEQLVVLKPGMLMGYALSSDYGQFKKMEDLGVPVVINAEYLEKHPLGRAEWIKFMALFFGQEKRADSVFQVIEKSYLEAKAVVDTVKTRPTVLSGIVYGDAWFLPGGQNYAARILNDAGCQYLWAADSSAGSLKLSFEHVYEKAHNADLWIGVGSYQTLEALRTGDHRYAQFKPVTTRQVYTYNARIGARGGSEFLELGYLRPDLILRDLVKIGHPTLLPEHTLYFHAPLQ